MTDGEFCKKWAQLDNDDRQRFTRLIDQMCRANALGIGIRLDDSIPSFFLVNEKTGNTVAPPPMNLPAVTAWLDTYEKKSTTK